MLYNSSLIVYANRPDGFNPRFQVISCYCLFKDKILFLQKSAKDKLEPNKWEVIIGKKHKNEEDEKALIRIIKEEIDVDLSKFNKKDFIRSNYFYLRSNNFDFLQTNYIFRFENLPKIKLSSQHQHFFWTKLGGSIYFLSTVAGFKEMFQREAKLFREIAIDNKK